MIRSSRKRGRCRCAPRFSKLLGEMLEPRTLLALSSQLLADINTTGVGASVVWGIIEAGGTAYFGSSDTLHGIELWKTNGTAAGTSLVKDINPSTDQFGHDYPRYLTNLSGTLVFTANDGVHGNELWQTDGTPAGTAILKELRAGNGGSNPRRLTNANGTLYFSANDGVSGYGLWKSDGTAGGTVLLKYIDAAGLSSPPEYFTAVGGTVFFTAYDSVHGRELWKTDGTATGTMLVKDIYAGTFNSGIYSLTNVNGTLFFKATDSTNGYELWKSDGTADGT